jgi:hypothetical protein
MGMFRSILTEIPQSSHWWIAPNGMLPAAEPPGVGRSSERERATSGLRAGMHGTPRQRVRPLAG